MRKRFWIFAMIVVTLFLLQSPSALAYGQVVVNNPGVVSPQGIGIWAYQDLSVRWWQWEFSLPWSLNPWNDTTGRNSLNGQSGNTFFLAGMLKTGTVYRNVTVTNKMRLFFPVLCSWQDNLGVNPPLSIAEIVAQLAASTSKATNLHASIDGKPITNLAAYRVQAAPFNYWLPPKNNVIQVFYQFNASGWVYGAASDGYWLLLEPLSAGNHVINFGGSFPQNRFTIDINYRVKVIPRAY